VQEKRIPKKRVLYMNLETTTLRGKPRNRWQDEVGESGMEEAPENGKESLHSAHANGMNE
jgi:hypothetical protein